MCSIISLRSFHVNPIRYQSKSYYLQQYEDLCWNIVCVSSRWCLGVLHCTVFALCVSEIQSCQCLFASWGAALSSWRKLNATEWHTLSQDSSDFLHKFYLNIINIFNKVHWNSLKWIDDSCWYRTRISLMQEKNTYEADLQDSNIISLTISAFLLLPRVSPVQGIIEAFLSAHVMRQFCSQVFRLVWAAGCTWLVVLRQMAQCWQCL